MKKLMMFFAGALLVFAGVSCQKINDLEGRVSDLENAVSQLKSQVEAGAVITAVSETETGYSLTLSNGKTYAVTNGAKGDKGDKGDKGEKGDKGADGDAFFGSVTVDPQTSTVTLVILKDGGATETIVIPMYVDSAVKPVKSIKFIPEYSDGKAVCTETKDGTRTLSASFDVRPAGVAAAIASKDIISLSVNAVATKAAAPSALAVATVEESNGIITVTADATAITAEAFSIALVAKDAAAEISSDYAIVAVEKTYVEYAGVKYNTVRLKDGKVWMAENLRYVPENLTPCKELTNVAAGIYYPVVVKSGKAEFSTEDETIAAQGYLYQTETAFGVAVNSITTEAEAKSFEGCRGICPEGWHIPTIDDIIGLVGKAVSPIATVDTAPYYDGKNGSIALLNKDGFNMAPCGAVSVIDNTKTSGTLMGALSAYPDRATSGYFCGSSYAGKTDNAAPATGLKNVQFWGLMPMSNKATEADYTCNGSKLSYKIAASVRCVKD